MAFLSRFKHDVFLSYAHEQNRARTVRNHQVRWVTEFRDRLKEKLVAKVGDEVDIYLDEDAHRSADFSKGIPADLEGSALFVGVLSRPYLRSSECMKETKLFQEKRARDGLGPELAESHSTRAIAVRCDCIDYHRLPEIFNKTNSYDFFEGEGRALDALLPSTPAFVRMVNRLGNEMAELLEEAKRQEAKGTCLAPAPAPEQLSPHSLFLASGPTLSQDEKVLLKSAAKAVVQQGWQVVGSVELANALGPGTTRNVVARDLNGDAWKQAIREVAVSVHLLLPEPSDLARAMVDFARKHARACAVWIFDDREYEAFLDEMGPKPDSFKVNKGRYNHLSRDLLPVVQDLTPRPETKQILISYQKNDAEEEAAEKLYLQFKAHHYEVFLDEGGENDLTVFQARVKARTRVVVFCGRNAAEEWLIPHVNVAFAAKRDADDVVVICQASPPDRSNLKPKLHPDIKWIQYCDEAFDQEAWEPILRFVRR